MKNLWFGLTDREKILVALGAACLFLFFLYILVIRPLIDQKKASEIALENEKSRYERVVNLASEVHNFGQLSESENQIMPIREAATEASRATSIAISRIQPGRDGRISFWIDTATSQEMFNWLILLQENYGKRVQKLSLQKNVGEETLRGQFEFKEELE